MHINFNLNIPISGYNAVDNLKAEILEEDYL